MQLCHLSPKKLCKVNVSPWTLLTDKKEQEAEVFLVGLWAPPQKQAVESEENYRFDLQIIFQQYCLSDYTSNCYHTVIMQWVSFRSFWLCQSIKPLHFRFSHCKYSERHQSTHHHDLTLQALTKAIICLPRERPLSCSLYLSASVCCTRSSYVV